jgi:hypothetical protein
MMDIALPVCRLDAVFRYVIPGEFEDDGFRMIYRDDGMKMMRHIFSWLGGHTRPGISPVK